MSPSCLACGERSKSLERHHYAPKSVVGNDKANSYPVHWLCRGCHASFHLAETHKAKSAVPSLSWARMLPTVASCERCRHGDARILAYAFWDPTGPHHKGPLCHACFSVFVTAQRDYHRVPLVQPPAQTVLF